jgi:hypothetical protein
MSVSVSVEVIGIKEALRELNSLDKEARRKITRDFKKITKPVEDTARRLIPATAPLSGMNRRWTTPSGFQMFPYTQAGKNSIVSQVSGRKPKMFAGHMTNLATFYIRFKGPAATLFDQSGKGPVPTRQGSQMVAALTNRFGPPSRVLWRAYEQHDGDVVRETQKLIDEMMDDLNRRRKDLKNWST